MKYFVSFIHCKVINGYQTFTFTFSSKSGVFTDDEIKHSASAKIDDRYKKFWRSELIIEKTVEVTKKEYARINNEMK
jgi:hypothetical protein